MATPIPENRARFDVPALVRATEGTLVERGADEAVTSVTSVTSVTTDSRAVAPGGAFVALVGASHDGHRFVRAAVDAGAALLVVDRAAVSRVRADLRPDDTCAVLAVDDTLVAWGAMARIHAERWRGEDASRRIVAITGSAGKTTTKELTAALLAEVAPTHATAGNLNNRIGMPAVVFGLEPSHRFAVLEMGMSLPGEIDAMASIARPDVAIVTNVLVAHAEGVGGREGVMREKGGVYRALGEGGIAIVNADDDFVVRAAGVASSRVTFGRSEGADVCLRSRDARGVLGSRLVLSRRVPRGISAEISVDLPLPGEAAAVDFAAALAAAESASGEVFDEARIRRAVSRVRLEGRATVATLGGDIVLLDDTYNANPGSMRAALATLGELAEGRRRVAVLGEMKELGALAEDEHRALGDAIADAGIDLVVGCGGLVSLALDRAAERKIAVIHAGSTDEAAHIAADHVRPSDAVLVKGSRSVGTERVVRRLKEVWPLSPKSASSEGNGPIPGRGRTE